MGEQAGLTKASSAPSVGCALKLARKLDHVPAAMFRVDSPSIRIPWQRHGREFPRSQELRWLMRQDKAPRGLATVDYGLPSPRARPTWTPGAGPPMCLFARELLPACTEGLGGWRTDVCHGLEHGTGLARKLRNALADVAEDGEAVNVCGVQRPERGAEAEAGLAAVHVDAVCERTVHAGAPGVQQGVDDAVRVDDKVVHDCAGEVDERARRDADKGSERREDAHLEEEFELVLYDSSDSDIVCV